MITSIRQPINTHWVTLRLLLLAAVVTTAAQGSYEKTLQTWRAEREAKLKADDGWLTVTGLFWLKEGANDFGSAPVNDIVLPPGGAPDKIGGAAHRGQGFRHADADGGAGDAGKGRPALGGNRCPHPFGYAGRILEAGLR